VQALWREYAGEKAEKRRTLGEKAKWKSEPEEVESGWRRRGGAVAGVFLE